MTLKVKSGDNILLHYRVSTDQGENIISTFEGDPVSLLVGANQLAKGLEKYLLGAEHGHRYVFSLQPGEAFGYYSAEMVQKIPLSEFAERLLLEQDKLIEFTLPNGDIVTGTLLEKTSEYAIVDFNHPLTDRAIQFEFEVVN